MNKFWKAVFINVVAVYGLSAITLLFGDATGLLLLPIILSAVEFFVGILVLIIVQNKEPGKIMLAASGILFLIGFGVCTAFPLRFH